LFCLSLAGADAENRRPSVALVLGGGAARGFAHIAVLEVIDEMGIPVDMVTGVSSGAIVGGLYAAGYSPAMMLEALEGRDWTSLFQDRPVSPFLNRNEDLPLVVSLNKSAGSIAPAWGSGFSPGQKVYELFKSLTAKYPSYLDFDRLPIPFRAGAVEVPSGKFELLSKGDLAEAIRASMSISGIFHPFVIDGKTYVDGGITNNLPVREVREMGFDIIIAVDLFAPPVEFPIEPMEVPELVGVLFSNHTSRDHHGLADLVFFPLPVNATTMDFSKGREIYALARGQRERLAALLEPIREKILGGKAESASVSVSGAYMDMPLLTPREMSIEGALPRDRSFIRKMFSRHIRGKALEENNITAFLESVYETGNYRMATMRTDTRGGETVLEVLLYPEAQNRILLRAGMDYEGTFSSRSSDWTALRAGVEFLGKSGFSLLLKASALDELSLGLSMLQPLGPHLFVVTEADLVREQELIIKGFLSRGEIFPERLLYFRGAMKGGLRFNRNNSLIIWPEYFWFKDEEHSYTMAGFGAAYTYNSFDHPLFPSRGFMGRVENRLRFDPAAGNPAPFDLASVDLAAAIPLGRHFSIGTSAYVSSLFGDTELPDALSTFDLAKVERSCFPHASWLFAGEKRAALSLALRFEPRERLSPLGGKLIFSLAAAAGRAGSFEWNDWERLSKDDLLWNVSFGAALLPLRYLGLQLRAGAGGGGGYQPAPFVSLDVGTSVFQK